jgi:hypothetical protein
MSANELPRSRSQRWPAISFLITSGYYYVPFGGTHVINIKNGVPGRLSKKLSNNPRLCTRVGYQVGQTFQVPVI